jgi:hypothetical protein
MSYTTIHQCANDTAFQDRVVAGAMKEAIAGGPEFSESAFGAQLKLYPQAAINTFMWPLSVAGEDAYAYAVDNGNENPGGDPGVITDADIQAGIQHFWPTDVLSTPIIPDPTVTGPEQAQE